MIAKYETSHSLFRHKRTYVLLAVILLFVFVLSCICGSTRFSISEFFNGLFWKSGYDSQSVIIHYLRIPRTIAGLLAGVGLSIAGVLLQSVTGNDLASPNIIGVNAGAGFFCIVLLSFFPNLWFFLPLAAFIGAFATTLLILVIAKRINASSATIILSGIACTTILNAGISFLSLLDTDVLSSYNAFSVGGLQGVALKQLLLPAIIITLSLTVSLFLSRQIHILCLGDALASALGVRVSVLRIVCMICASASAAAVVSFAGLLGFIGLVVPHIARRLCGNSIAPLLIVSALLGGILVILADLFGRVILAPTEIPVGILMALIGAPFFFSLLLRRRRAYD